MREIARSSARAARLMLAAALSSACIGSVAGDAQEGQTAGPGGARAGGRGGAGGGSGATTPAPSNGESVGPLRLLRLTRDQYEATVRDLLGINIDLARELPHDTAGDSGFREPGTVGAREARSFMDAAEAAAAMAARDLPTLMGCDPARDEAACVSGFLARFGRRAFRRPLVPDEEAALRAHFDGLRRASGASVTEAVRGTVATVLQAPSFIYRWELGPRAPSARGGIVSLTAYELASRLSYFVWGTMPDDALFAAAESGALVQPAELDKQVRRLLASPRSRSVIARFHEEWLGLGEIETVEKDTGVYPEFTEDLRKALLDETRVFIGHVFGEGDGKLETLFGASYSFFDERVAKLYGATGVKGTMPLRRDLPATERFGLLTQAAFLATHAYPYDSAPAHRGVIVRERLLCQTVPPVPGNLMPMPPLPDPKVPIREQFVQHAKDPACAPCHSLFDPLGFAFENYDGIGRYRRISGGRPVDATGVLTGLAVGDRSFTDARELLQLVRASPEHRKCVVSQWLRYALGRKEGPEDAGAQAAIHAAFERGGFDMRELVVAVVGSTAFRFRSPSAGEVLQ